MQKLTKTATASGARSSMGHFSMAGHPAFRSIWLTTASVLKDGDVIQPDHMEWPSYVYNYVYREAVDWTNMSSSLGALRFKETGAQTAAAGGEAMLTVERTSAHLWSWTGSYSPYEGATIAAYGPQNEDGSYPDTPILLTGTSSDASGSRELQALSGGQISCHRLRRARERRRSVNFLLWQYCSSVSGADRRRSDAARCCSRRTESRTG